MISDWYQSPDLAAARVMSSGRAGTCHAKARPGRRGSSALWDGEQGSTLSETLLSCAHCVGNTEVFCLSAQIWSRDGEGGASNEQKARRLFGEQTPEGPPPTMWGDAPSVFCRSSR